MRRLARVALALACLSVPVLAQDRKPPADDNRPTLTFRDGEAVKPLTIAKADVTVMITGYLAETTLTLTFKNDHSRVLEGELSFPLPQGATVSGYGLDVGGVLVDGVPVEKHQARVAYETELRKGVDPGLVEHVRGNNFRTRVYPIPANGTRTVKVQYVSDLAHGDDGAAYVLPLNWGGERVAECNVHVQVQQTPVAPKLRGGPAELAFVQEDAKTVARRTYKDVAFTDDLTISLPSAPPRHVVVESRQTNDDGTEHHFVVFDAPNEPPHKQAIEQVRPNRVGILWDASLSRAAADKSRELDLLRRLFSTNPQTTFDLVVFRDRIELPLPFKDGDFDKLKAHLDALAYDGGTNLASLPVRKNIKDVGPRAQSGPLPPDFAYWLCFTDGLANLMDERPKHLEAPLYVISNDSRASHDALAHLARLTGGQYLNLKRLSDDQALSAIGRPAFSLLSVDAPPGTVADVLPAGVTPVQGRLAISGKLLADEATLTLNYGMGTSVMHSETVTVRRSAATATGLAPRFWAQQKITELAAQADKNKDALLALGREFNLVTPNTSLMVLETLEQHLTHDIAPAKTRGEMYAAYVKASQDRRLAKDKAAADKTQPVLAMWQKRLDWHAKEFKVDPGFKYVAPPQTAVGPALGRVAGREAGGRAVAAPLVVSDAAPDAPLPTERAPAQQPARPLGQVEERLQDLRAIDADRDGAAEGEVALRQRLASQGNRGVIAGGPVAANHRYYSATTVDNVTRSKGDGVERADARVTLAGWDPQTPYLKALQLAKPGDRYATYLTQRAEHGQSPAFFLDCADFFLKNNEKDLGLRILTNVAELELDSPALLRIVAHRLAQLGQLDLAVDLFEKVLKLRPEEPQSHRDLALALAERNRSDDRARALALLKDVVTKPWDGRFPEIETIALLEHNRLASAMGVARDLHPKLRDSLDADIRILLTWDADLTDIDLWITEPTGEKCAYDHPATTIGGVMSKDFTQGYGPEEYLLKKALPGKYRIQANYYGSGQQKLAGPTTVQATVITNFGRPDEKRQAFTVRLASQREVIDLGTIEFGGQK